MTSDVWERVMDIWERGGVVTNRKDRKPRVEDYEIGLDYIDRGMTNLGFMRVNGGNWVPKEF
jgi:hypothetical protein